MATGKSFWASGGKKTSTAFFGNGWLPVGGVPTSMMCNCIKWKRYALVRKGHRNIFSWITPTALKPISFLFSHQSPFLQPGLWQQSRTELIPLCFPPSWTGQSWRHGLRWAEKPFCQQSTAAWLPPLDFAEKRQKIIHLSIYGTDLCFRLKLLFMNGYYANMWLMLQLYTTELSTLVLTQENMSRYLPGLRYRWAGAISAWRQCGSW